MNGGNNQLPAMTCNHQHRIMTGLLNTVTTGLMHNKLLVLGSSSPYRKELLERLGLPFLTDRPGVDESPRAGESAEKIVRRLSQEKALAVSVRYPDALVIGCDQVAAVEDRIVGKPGNHEAAVKQLKEVSGKTITLYTGLALLNSKTGVIQVDVVPFSVTFRILTGEMIEEYLRRDKPYDCTGSVRVEGLGIALLERLEGDDPNALIGLPLIRLITMLKEEGLSVIQ